MLIGTNALSHVADATTARITPRHRSAAFDYLRMFVVLLVLAHHSVVAYAVFGRFNPANYLDASAPIVDPRRWLGFDMFYLATEVFFMPLLFLLSGLFVRSSLQRHGPAGFLRERLLRLGVPFVAGLLVLMPLAYYPSFRLGGGAPGLLQYWWNTVAFGPRPNGPLWFIGVLLLFDVAAAALFAAGLDWSGRPSEWVIRRATRPSAIFAALLAVSILAYLPALLRFGPGRWLLVGPLLIQPSRIPCYAVYFAAGIVLGRAGAPVLSERGAWARRWLIWALGAVACCAGFIVWSMAEQFGMLDLPPLLARALAGLVFASTCCVMTFALVALFLRFARRRAPLFDSLTANAYGIYLLHYVPLVWLQFALVPTDLPAWAKAALVLAGTLGASWGAVAAARRISAVRAVLS
jgi:glucan biosynthesis protein C